MLPGDTTITAEKTGFLRSMHGQVLIAILLGIAVGALWPAFGASLKPLGDAFIKLIQMVIGPVILPTTLNRSSGILGWSVWTRISSMLPLLCELTGVPAK